MLVILFISTSFSLPQVYLFAIRLPRLGLLIVLLLNLESLVISS